MILSLFIQVIFIFIFCLVLATLEVQIEGKAGWATNLPTWRPSATKWYSRLYGKIMGGRDLTGYHISIFSLVFIFLHYPYFTGEAWSLVSELTTLSFLLIVIIVWDFLWFVINPRYDFRHFWAEKVWWHKKWFLHLPLDYWFAVLISALFYTKLSFNWLLFKEWLEIIGLFLVFTLTVVVFAIAAGVFKIKENTNK